MNGEVAVEARALTKRYGSVEAVSDLHFAVHRHGVTGFLGRNGAGKSTTIKMLLGMTRPTAGSGAVLGYRIDDPGGSLEIRRRVAYVGEDKGLYAYMTARQLIRFTRSFYDDWRPEVERRLIAAYQLPLDRKVKTLSKGMRTKLALLLALARRPAVLILDEPTEGLDPVSIEALLRTLAAVSADGTAVFFSSHQLGEVERIADRVLVIDQGRLSLDVEMDQLRQHYRRVTASFTSNAPETAFILPGIERVRAVGRQVTMLARHDAERAVERARSLGAVSVDVAPVSLREVFLDTVKPDTLEEDQDVVV